MANYTTQSVLMVNEQASRKCFNTKGRGHCQFHHYTLHIALKAKGNKKDESPMGHPQRMPIVTEDFRYIPPTVRLLSLSAVVDDWVFCEAHRLFLEPRVGTFAILIIIISSTAGQ